MDRINLGRERERERECTSVQPFGLESEQTESEHTIFPQVREENAPGMQQRDAARWQKASVRTIEANDFTKAICAYASLIFVFLIFVHHLGRPLMIPRALHATFLMHSPYIGS